MVSGNLQQGIHLTTDSGIVDGKDGPRARRDNIGHESFIDVHRIGTNLGKDRLGTCPNNRIGGRDESKGGQNDFVTRSEVAQHCRHLERGGTGRSHQHGVELKLLLQQL